ncbi:hypothetical protein [Modestobacter marinus]|uniref:Excreted virulence factor EspC, type VII ESX diderm n=1 Tax=Modestobacter marinus TaxID=477641 RepID=A0A846LLE1_9ACTN|nr:hypothetical protein [Modestobacter marinus]NIH66135.1 hypothetical protein [Modestobacter marinus]
MSHLISVQLDALGRLSAELTVLGAELGEEGRLTASTGRSLGTALAGPVGDDAAGVGAGWAEVIEALAARTLAVAATLDAALAAYRRMDAGLAGQLGPGRVGAVPVPR